MMKDSLPRILLALASADAGRSDLSEFLRWIELNGIDQAAEILRSLRMSANNIHRESGRGLSSDVSFESTHHISEKQLVVRIEKLMLESGLTKAATVKATTDLLKERGYPTKSLPDSNKIAFRMWVEKLLRQVPADELLNVASIVRNHSVHGIDWPLRRGKP
jgi:hypothetical protein